jgi:hypothetical protein
VQRSRRRTRAFVGRTAVAGEGRRKGGEVETEMALVLAPLSESVFPPSCAFFDVHQLDGQVPRSLPRVPIGARSAGGVGTVGNID